jgi:hypothetical protein
MIINITTHNYSYYKVVQLNLRYEDYITLILHKNCYLKNLFEFLKISGRITTYNFMQINTITPN